LNRYQITAQNNEESKSQDTFQKGIFLPKYYLT